MPPTVAGVWRTYPEKIGMATPSKKVCSQCSVHDKRSIPKKLQSTNKCHGSLKKKRSGRAKPGTGAGFVVPARTERGRLRRQTPRPGSQAGPHRAACDRPNSTAFAPARHTATQEPMWLSPWQQCTRQHRKKKKKRRGEGKRR